MLTVAAEGVPRLQHYQPRATQENVANLDQPRSSNIPFFFLPLVFMFFVYLLFCRGVEYLNYFFAYMNEC